jgi:hypothetical protein
MNDVAIWAHLAPAIKGTPPCPSSLLPDDDGDDLLADLLADEWDEWLDAGTGWVFDVLDSLTTLGEPRIDVKAAAEPELDTYGMSAGALLQVVFNPAPQSDETLLRAVKALREMVESYGDGVCQAAVQRKLAAQEWAAA